jgi:hypothetical protein
MWGRHVEGRDRRRHVNLPAHLSCWNVINDRSIGGLQANAQLFREMF